MLISYYVARILPWKKQMMDWIYHPWFITPAGFLHARHQSCLLAAHTTTDPHSIVYILNLTGSEGGTFERTNWHLRVEKSQMATSACNKLYSESEQTSFEFHLASARVARGLMDFSERAFCVFYVYINASLSHWFCEQKAKNSRRPAVENRQLQLCACVAIVRMLIKYTTLARAVRLAVWHHDLEIRAF